MSKQRSPGSSRIVSRRWREPAPLDLLISLEPNSDESLRGFLHRLAEANGLDGAFVTKLFKAEICSNRGLVKPFSEMASSWAGVACEIAAPSTRPMPLWNVRSWRFCGKCLAKGAYWRAYWDLSLVTCCVEHGARLRDSCRHCGKMLEGDDGATLACPNCNRKFANPEEDIRANQDELWLSQELKLAFRAETGFRSRHLQHLNLESLHELAFRLGACAFHPLARKPLKIADSGVLVTASRIAEQGAAMLRNWPDGFSKGLNKIRAARGEEDDWKLGISLGPIYQQIFDKLPGPEFQFIRGAFEEYLLENWAAPLARRHSRLDKATVAEHRWLPLDEAASRMQMTRADVARLVESGEVESRHHTSPSGRITRIVNTASLLEVVADLRRAVSAREAARRLGLSKERVVRLIGAKFLKAWGGPPRAGTAWIIGYQSVNALLSVSAAAPIVRELNAHQVSFAHLMRFVARDDKTFGRILGAAVSGTIAIVGSLGIGGRISDWIFERDDVNVLLGHTIANDGGELTVVQVAGILDIKQEVAYALVQHKAIRSRIRMLNGRPARFVKSSELEVFRHKFVLGTQIAKLLGCSPKYLAQLLSQNGIYPHGGPALTTRFCRQYYWKASKKLDNFVRLRGKQISTS